MYNFNYFSNSENVIVSKIDAPQGKNITTPYKISDDALRLGFGNKWLRYNIPGWYAVDDQDIYTLLIGNPGGLNVISDADPGNITAFACHAYLYRNPKNGMLAYACFFTRNVHKVDASDDQFFFVRASYNRDVGEGGQTINWIVENQIASIHYKVSAPIGAVNVGTIPLLFFTNGTTSVTLTYTSSGTITTDSSTSVTATSYSIPDTIWVVDRQPQITQAELSSEIRETLQDVEEIVGDLSNKFVAL